MPALIILLLVLMMVGEAKEQAYQQGYEAAQMEYMHR